MVSVYRPLSAIEGHSQQVDLFESRYAAALVDPFSSCFAYSRKRLQPWMDRSLPVNGPIRSVLDVGCGTGHQLAALTKLGFVMSGVDGSAEMVSAAKRLNPSLDVRVSRVEALPFQDGSFDAVIAIELLRYLEDVNPALAEIHRVLSPNGIALLTACPRYNLNGYTLLNRMTASGRLPGFTALKQHFTTRRQLTRDLRSAGFGSVEIHGVYSGPLNWLERIAPSLLRPVLRRWEPVDARIADLGALREFSNMFVTLARKG
ncbi:MAG: class I SAM-dependent methyltransferase [Vicinamibacteria bacterium]